MSCLCFATVISQVGGRQQDLGEEKELGIVEVTNAVFHLPILHRVGLEECL